MSGLLTERRNPRSAAATDTPLAADPQTPHDVPVPIADASAFAANAAAARGTRASTPTRLHSTSGGVPEPGEEVETGLGGGLDSSPPTGPEIDPTLDPTLGRSLDSTRTQADRLSVAELRHALRIARAARQRHPIPPIDLPDAGSTTHWLPVLAAHSGAGASTVALALAEVCQQRSTRAVHLVEWADPQRSGLVAATIDELGVDASGAWRHGQRNGVTVHRRTRTDIALAPPVTPSRRSHWPSDCDTAASDTAASDTAARPVAGPSPVIILDLSGTFAELDPTLVIASVVVLRATVPGVRAAESLLESLTQHADSATTPRIVAAALRPRRWNAAVAAGFGPRLRGLRDEGLLITVPVDRRLSITGPTTAPLPSPLLAAARELLTMLDLDSTDGGAPQKRRADPLTEIAHSAADCVRCEDAGAAPDLLASLAGGDGQLAEATR